MELVIGIAFILDLIFADPEKLPHPISLIGSLIRKSEKFFRGLLGQGANRELIGGAITVLVVCGISYLVPLAILRLCSSIHPTLKLLVEGFMCFQIFAAGSLKKESMKVYYALEQDDLNLARKYLSYIVGRDTAHLDQEAVARAAVETVAENTTDGVVAPLIFMAIGGAPLGFFYKAVNTMDSMIGYKNEKYFYFGKVAARLDDLLNLIPARLAAWLMVVVSKSVNLNSRNAIKILRRDGNNHSSPNSGKTEAACAGALGIRLGGANYYFGKLVEKPTIGDALESVKPKHILEANRLMYKTSMVATALVVIIMIIGGNL